jgi:hypothetical protein
MEMNLPTSSALSIPEELKGPLPRKERLTSRGLTTRVYACGLLLFAIGLILWFGVDAARRFLHRTELRREGREASGEIIRFWSPGRSLNWKISYSFAVDESSFGGEARVPKQLENDLGKDLSDNSPLPIRYLPTDPSVNCPVGWEESSSSILKPLIVWGLGAIFLAMMAVGLLLPFPSDRRLIREGLPAVGVVTKFNPRKGRNAPTVCYEFHSEDGRTISGISPGDDAPEVGANVCVLYLPQNPQRNQRYPLPYFHLADGLRSRDASLLKRRAK